MLDIAIVNSTPIVLELMERSLPAREVRGVRTCSGNFFSLCRDPSTSSSLTRPHRPFVGVSFPRGEGGEDLQRKFFLAVPRSIDIELVNPTPIVLSLESRFLGRGV